MRMRGHPSRKPGRAMQLPLAVIRAPRARPRHNGFVVHAWLHRAGCRAVRTARSWRDIVPFTHLAREGRMTVTIRRRELLAALGGAAVAWPRVARAQQPAMPVVGVLRDSTAAGSEHMVNGFRKGLAEAGFVEGRNLTIEYAWTDGRSERLSTLAAELVGRHVPVIVSSAINATFAAKAATSTIPVVFAVNIDPVASGLVASLNRPGGNLTGVSYLTSELGAKRLGLMHEMVPRVTDFAVLAHPTYPASARFISDVEAAARSSGFRIEVFNASTESEIDTAFAGVSARGLGALLIANNTLFTSRREHISALAARYA